MPFEIDRNYMQQTLLKLLSIHSPSGYTDPIVRVVCEQLDELGVPFELTRRGAIRATLPTRRKSGPRRAVVTHVDTLGAMVKELKPNGRLGIVPVGTWSSRFAEGARVSIFTDEKIFRGTILPLKASGHVYNTEVDTQPIDWDHVEIRIDENVVGADELYQMGFRVGDFVGVDSQPELLANGYLNARHLDNKGGVSAALAAAKYLVENPTALPAVTDLLFTISEEVGSGASAVLTQDVVEMVSIDNGTVAAGQASREFGITVAMGDSTGPFDFHLTRHLLNLCKEHRLVHARDVFKYYRSDSASALDAGNDTRTALITFGVDASHGYERTNLDSLDCIAQLVVAYARSDMLFKPKATTLTKLKDFPKTRKVDVDMMTKEQQEAVAQIPPEN